MKTWNKPVFTTLEIAETECYNYGPVFNKPRYPKRRPGRHNICPPTTPEIPEIPGNPEEPEDLNS